MLQKARHPLDKLPKASPLHTELTRHYLEQLERLFRPQVEPVVRRLLKEVVEPAAAELDAGISWLFKIKYLFITIASLEWLYREWWTKEDWRHGEVQTATVHLVREWIETLLEQARRESLSCSGAVPDTLHLDADSLDDAMLPPDYSLELLDENALTRLGGDALMARQVLHAVKAALPVGQPLPTAAWELLRLYGVEVRIT